MKKVGIWIDHRRAVVVLAFVSSLLAFSARAQVPIIQVYLDDEFQITDAVCPGFGLVDTLYVVASNFSVPIVDVEYQILGFGSFSPLFDILPSGFTATGFSGAGINVSFGGPADATGLFLVERIGGGWFCADCTGPILTLSVVPHPDSGKIQATAWPTLSKIEAAGGINILCTSIPVRETTWGKVKALFR
jgi:hypothetical protein